MVGVITIGGAIFSMFSPLYAVLCVARAILGYGMRGIYTSAKI